eukprot:6193207-Lingulodinium_polyedra.AAC.1
MRGIRAPQRSSRSAEKAAPAWQASAPVGQRHGAETVGPEGSRAGCGRGRRPESWRWGRAARGMAVV